MKKASNVLIGVTGGVAAYKILELLRLLIKKGVKVKVVLTRGAEKFVTPFSFLSLGAEEVFTDDNQFSVINGSSIHLYLAKWADVVLVAPATADFIAKASAGIADNLLLTTLLAFTKTVLFAPAMNENMLIKNTTQNNIEALKSIGWEVVEPEEGYLANLEVGKGRLKEPEEIFEDVLVALYPKPLKGKRVLLTCGATKEFIDPVRFITNGSSGKMGIALAKVARRLGAEVTLIYGGISEKLPYATKKIKVTTTEDMFEAVKSEVDNNDILIMAAAPADYMPREFSREKLPKKDSLVLELQSTVDILKSVKDIKGDKCFVGFALQTENLVGNAKKKLEEKGLDFIVANMPENIASDKGKIVLVDKAGNTFEYEGNKEDLAEFILSTIIGG